MKLFIRAFTEHPASVNETYIEHLRAASSFAFSMIGAGIACLVHALLPFLFVTTASETIKTLHERMVTKRIATKAGTDPHSNESSTDTR